MIEHRCGRKVGGAEHITINYLGTVFYLNAFNLTILQIF
jgi:hypothetical protein